MKILALLLFFVLYINFSDGIAKFERCSEKMKPIEDPEKTCVKVTCTSLQNFAVLGCTESRCPPGKQIGVKKVDHSKIYPHCCGGPICAN